MKYKGWIIDLPHQWTPFKFEAGHEDGDYPTKYSDSVDDLMEEIDEEQS
jgi:hypothetical protein